MKQLNRQYIDEHINETLSEFLGKFWDWLVGNNNKGEYTLGNANYDEKAKKAQINNSDKSEVSLKPANLAAVKELIKNGKPDSETKSIYDKLDTWISGHPMEVSKMKWYVWAYRSKELKEGFAIQPYRPTSSKDETAAYLPIFCYDKLYSKFITAAAIKDSFDKICADCGKDRLLIEGYDKAKLKEISENFGALCYNRKGETYWIYEKR